MEYTKIGEYTILKLLGTGSMGAVYRAKDSQGQVVALKVITQDFSDNKEYIQRFMREIQVACKLRHKNILPTLDFGVDIDEDLLFAVMEYIPGVNLDQVLQKRGNFPIRETLLIIAQVALGLEYAWTHQVIHRDIKPANLMMDKKGVIKIADFGLVKDKGALSLTESGTALGSPAYMSPEQVRGEDVDIRSDIYSLGIVLYEMLTGTTPFKNVSPIQVMLMHTKDPIPPLKKYLGRDARHLQPLLDKMTSKDRDHRLNPTELLKNIRSFKFD